MCACGDGYAYDTLWKGRSLCHSATTIGKTNLDRLAGPQGPIHGAQPDAMPQACRRRAHGLSCTRKALLTSKKPTEVLRVILDDHYASPRLLSLATQLSYVGLLSLVLCEVESLAAPVEQRSLCPRTHTSAATRLTHPGLHRLTWNGHTMTRLTTLSYKPEYERYCFRTEWICSKCYKSAHTFKDFREERTGRPAPAQAAPAPTPPTGSHSWTLPSQTRWHIG